MRCSPLRAAALAFIGGVALGAWLPQEPQAWGWAAAVVLGAWAVCLAAGASAAGTRSGLIVFVCVGVFRLQADLRPLFAGAEPPPEGDATVAGRVALPQESRDGETVLHVTDVRVRRGGETVMIGAPLQVVVSGEPGLAAGDLITARGRLRPVRGDRNFGWFPGPVAPRGRRYWARLIVESPVWVRRDGHDPGRGPGAAVLRWRSAADRFWRSQPGAAGAVLNALTTGERASLPLEVRDAFQRSGLTHILAISGMNVGFLAAIVFVVLLRLLARWEALVLRWPAQPFAAALTLPALWFFLLFSGSQIPVARAVVSGAAGLAAVVLWRRAAPADSVALAALALVCHDPQALFSASFQLSFVAVVALLLVSPRLVAPGPPGPPGREPVGAWGRIWRGARAVFVVSAAASAATAPLVAFHFQQVSLVGPLANLLAVPYSGLIVLPSAWLALGAQAVWAPAGAALARCAIVAADLLIGIADWFAAPHWAAVGTARPSLLLTIALLALVAAILRCSPQLVTWARCGSCAAAAGAGTAWLLATHGPGMLVTVLDVGQGLAVAAALPGGGSLLFDAGPRWGNYDAGERLVVPALRRLGVSRLDVLAISHAHPDHAGGADAVRREVGARRIWQNSGPHGLSRGDRLALGGGVGGIVLNPARGGTGGADENDRSLALLLTLGDTGMVLTGDAGPVAASGLAAAIARPPAKLALQAPHHGGSAAACRTLATILRPELSMVSVGRNTYGHPRVGALQALERSGPVLRTDRDGAIMLRSDGLGFTVRCWRDLATARTWPERVRWLVAGW